MTSVEGTFRFDDVGLGPALITGESGKHAEGELNVPQAGCVTADLKIVVSDRGRLQDSQ